MESEMSDGHQIGEGPKEIEGRDIPDTQVARIGNDVYFTVPGDKRVYKTLYWDGGVISPAPQAHAGSPAGIAAHPPADGPSRP